MKKFLAAIVLVMGISVGAIAQTTTKKTKKHRHVCTAACMNGKHIYAHGEKKHKCTADCAKMAGEKMELKDHVCTEACKEGKHIYAHGEKGHVCTEACKPKM